MKNNKKTTIALMALITAHSVFADPHWTYEIDGDTAVFDGQNHWAEIIDPTSTAPVPLNYPYVECGIGQKQSPINISTPLTNQAKLNDITLNYHANPLVVENNGHTIKVNESITSPGTMYIGNILSYDEYTLLQYHIHSPSEHTVNGVSYPMEIHFVHGTPDGKLAVIGVVVQPGTHNNELQKILDNAPASVATNSPENVFIDPRGLDTRNYVSYAGSLTTPPCTEGVNWYVLTTPIEASGAQITSFQSFFTDNARQTQNLNGRVANLKK